MEDKIQDHLQQEDMVHWNTERVNELLRKAEEEGLDFKSVENPFHDNNPELKRANVVWEYTKDEILEMKRCAEDVTYFSQYCKVMTDEGLRYIELRDYQASVLREYQNNRFSIFLAPRQIGKCFFPANSITEKNRGNLIVNDLKPMNSKKFIGFVKKILYRIYSWI